MSVLHTFRAAAGPWYRAALSLLYPEWCQLCAKTRATPAESFVCQACRETVRFIQPPFCRRCGRPYEGAITNEFECTNCRELDLQFSSARSAVYAEGAALEVIHRYKYHRAFWFEPLLVQWLVSRAAPALTETGTKWDCIVPVPLHPAKQRQREFNQAERLAKGLGAAVGLPVQARRLQRTHFTESQTFLSREQRQANMRRAFSLRKGQRLNGERVVLVDDVFTTGATSGACARALLAAGAGEVCVWTVARGA